MGVVMMETTDADDTLEIKNSEDAFDAIRAGEISQNDEITVRYVDNSGEGQTETGLITNVKTREAGETIDRGQWSYEADQDSFTIEYDVEGKNTHTIHTPVDDTSIPTLRTEVDHQATRGDSTTTREIGGVIGIEVDQGERCCVDGCDNALPIGRTSDTCSTGCDLEKRTSDDSDDETVYEVRTRSDDPSANDVHCETHETREEAEEHAAKMNGCSETLTYFVEAKPREHAVIKADVDQSGALERLADAAADETDDECDHDHVDPTPTTTDGTALHSFCMTCCEFRDSYMAVHHRNVPGSKTGRSACKECGEWQALRSVVHEIGDERTVADGYISPDSRGHGEQITLQAARAIAAEQ